MERKEKLTADQPARWPWESPPHVCRVRKKGRGRKRHTIPRGVGPRRRAPPTQTAAATLSAPATTAQKQEKLKERVAEVVAATMGVIKRMTHPDAALEFQPQMHPRGPDTHPESSPDSGDSVATEVYAAAETPAEILPTQDRVQVTKPVAKRKREEGAALASVSTPDPTSISTPRALGASHSCAHSPNMRATGTQECIFTCGRSQCRQCTFSIVRQEPDRGAFAWQEMVVTMCEHGGLSWRLY